MKRVRLRGTTLVIESANEEYPTKEVPMARIEQLHKVIMEVRMKK